MVISNLTHLTKKIGSTFGIDGAIGFSILSKIVSAGGSFGIITLISLFLTKDEQGYYYTFGSIVALQVFLELGLGGIITQYVAHEVVHLEPVNKTEYAGDVIYISRLSSILHFTIKVFSLLSVLLFLVLIVSGYLFFNNYQTTTNIHWQLPWFLLSLSTSLLLIINPIMSFFEGLGKVKDVARIRLIQQLVNLTTLGLVLFFKGKLYALGLSALASFSVLLLSILLTNRKKIITFIYKSRGIHRVSYRNEIFPYQWKIALSWVSGYFIFQLFNPVLFATESPRVAGQMGMVLQVLNGISAISMSWISTKVPLMSSMIARKSFHELDVTFNKTLKQLSAINLLGLAVFITGIFVLNFFHLSFAGRFLPIEYVILLSVVTFLNQFVFSWATYLRCHKDEPFLINSIVIGALCAISTFVFGSQFGLKGLVLGYVLITVVVGTPWAYMIFKRFRLRHYYE